MRIVFMGTPDIAAASLRALYAAGHEIAGVFTREDKPVGRKQVLTAPPVKQEALAHGSLVYQPRTLRDAETQAQLRALAPELIVVVAYGRILPPEVLAIPPRGCLNLHVSLLPQYRGSAPIQWAVLNGDTRTGVTIMQLDEGVDTGDILLTVPVEIGPEETSGELFERMSELGAATLVDCLARLDSLTPTPQEDAKATKAPPLTKEMARLDFARPAAQLHNWVRGMNPWPVAYFEHEGKKIKVLKSRLAPGQPDAVPGTVLAAKPLTVACGKDALELCALRPEGKGEMDGTAWALGRHLQPGDNL